MWLLCGWCTALCQHYWLWWHIFKQTRHKTSELSASCLCSANVPLRFAKARIFFSHRKKCWNSSSPYISHWFLKFFISPWTQLLKLTHRESAIVQMHSRTADCYDRDVCSELLIIEDSYLHRLCGSFHEFLLSFISHCWNISKEVLLKLIIGFIDVVFPSSLFGVPQ